MNGEKSNEEKAAEVVAEAIRDSFALHGSGKGRTSDENIVEVLAGIYTQLRRVADALEAANERRGRG